MNTKKPSPARKFLAKLRGGPLTFGRMIESLRTCDEISQVELAKRMGMSKAHLCDIEKERRFVTSENAARFARVMGYDVSHFVSVVLEDQLRKAGLKLRVDLKAA